MAIPRTVSSVAMPWKSAGVGFGAVVEMEPHPATTRATTRAAARAAASRSSGGGAGSRGGAMPGEAITSAARTVDRGTMRHWRYRVPHPALRRRSVARQVVAALLVCGALMPLVATAPRVAAVEPTDSPNRLDQPIADLALLEPSGPDDAPRLLVVDAIESSPGVVRVAILRRDGAWDVDSEMQVDLGTAGVTPWLVGLGPTRFALLAVTPSAEGTMIVGIQTDAGAGRADLAETARQSFNEAIDDAGAADVDGDGTAELVVANARTVRAGGTCQGSTVRILDGIGLVQRTSVSLPGRRLAAGVIGRWDDVSGDDLLAYAYPNCPAGPDTAAEVGLIAVRLTDGSIVLDRGGIGLDAGSFVGPPIRLDMDGTGMHEVLALDARGLSVLDPTSGWGAHPIGSSLASAVVAGAGPEADSDAAGVRVAWVEMEGAGSILTARLIRDDRGSISIVDRDDLAQPDATPSRLNAAFIETFAAVQRQVSPAGWLGATTNGGCPDLVLAGAILQCGATELRAGAAWIGTRPVTVLDDDGNRRLVVAAGLGRDPSSGYPQTPSPWATAPAGWWRHGPSGPFALSELRAADLMYFRDFPSPSATLERTSAADATTGIPGFTGVRMFVRVSALGADAAEPLGDPMLGTILPVEASDSTTLLTSRIKVPPGVEAGRDGGLATIRLGDTTLADGTRADRWSVAVVPVNDWGEIGSPVGGVVIRDAVGPLLVVEAPFTSAIWPFTATIAGSAEPRSVVRVAGIGDMELDRRGRFTIQTPLAPWPQTLSVSAADASGNITIREVSVIGGIDYRRFPWAMIAALALLVVVAASGLIGSRRRGGPPGLLGGRVVMSTADDGPIAEMEELPPGGGLT